MAVPLTSPFPSPFDDYTGPGEIPPRGLADVRLVSSLPQPAQIDGLDVSSCVALRRLADGRLMVIEPLLMGLMRLCIGRPAVMVADGPLASWDDEWHYDGGLAALLALALWEPTETPEPTGWVRHPRSARRRPNGDPAREEVRP